jgi:hypothetical protein
MKSIEKDSRREFESRQVHHKHSSDCPDRPVSEQVVNMYYCVFDGPAQEIDWVKSNEMDSPAM